MMTIRALVQSLAHYPDDLVVAFGHASGHPIPGPDLLPRHLRVGQDLLGESYLTTEEGQIRRSSGFLLLCPPPGYAAPAELPAPLQLDDLSPAPAAQMNPIPVDPPPSPTTD